MKNLRELPQHVRAAMLGISLTASSMSGCETDSNPMVEQQDSPKVREVKEKITKMFKNSEMAKKESDPKKREQFEDEGLEPWDLLDVYLEIYKAEGKMTEAQEHAIRERIGELIDYGLHMIAAGYSQKEVFSELRAQMGRYHPNKNTILNPFDPDQPW